MISTMFSLLLQFAFMALVSAEDFSAASHGNAWQYGAGGGVVGFIVLVLDVIVFIEVLKSNRPPLQKVLWCLLVFLFPIIGLIIYWLFSNRAAHAPGSGYEPIP